MKPGDRVRIKNKRVANFGRIATVVRLVPIMGGRPADQSVIVRGDHPFDYSKSSCHVQHPDNCLSVAAGSLELA